MIRVINIGPNIIPFLGCAPSPTRESRYLRPDAVSTKACSSVAAVATYHNILDLKQITLIFFTVQRDDVAMKTPPTARRVVLFLFLSLQLH